MNKKTFTPVVCAFFSHFSADNFTSASQNNLITKYKFRKRKHNELLI